MNSADENHALLEYRLDDMPKILVATDSELRLPREFLVKFPTALDSSGPAFFNLPRPSQTPGVPGLPPTTISLFETFELLLPKRLRDEELSDAREMIHGLVLVGASPWKIYAKTFSTGFWCLLNALGYVVATVLGRNRNKS